MKLPWLKSLEENWRASIQSDRIPHAVLLLGPEGVGKRCAASWLAQVHLGLEDMSSSIQFPLRAVEHADLRWVSPPEDKQMIGIEQIRSLVADLSLTSYEGSGKVAILDPANRMTASAANSLLKTLEEPRGNALLILIADRVGRLPATIFSRCQRLKIGSPTESEAIAWLDQQSPAEPWREILSEVGTAPLAALVAAERQPDTQILARDFAELASQRAAPLEVAGRWSKYEADFVLKWLSRQIQSCIQQSFSGQNPVPVKALSDSVLQRIDRRNLFCYLDTINGLNGQPAGSYNVLLTFESLLIDWAGALRTHNGLAQIMGNNPVTGTELNK